MNEKELKAQLLEAGATEEQIAKVDFAKIESIIDNASSIEGLSKSLKEAYPDFNEEEFKKAVAENTKDNDAVENLSDEALEAVAGGSVGSWLNKNKAWLIPVATIAAVGIGGAIIYGVKRKLAANAAAKPQRSSSISSTDTSYSNDSKFQWMCDY